MHWTPWKGNLFPAPNPMELVELQQTAIKTQNLTVNSHSHRGVCTTKLSVTQIIFVVSNRAQRLCKWPIDATSSTPRWICSTMCCDVPGPCLVTRGSPCQGSWAWHLHHIGMKEVTFLNNHFRFYKHTLMKEKKALAVTSGNLIENTGHLFFFPFHLTLNVD